MRFQITYESEESKDRFCPLTGKEIPPKVRHYLRIQNLDSPCSVFGDHADGGICALSDFKSVKQACQLMVAAPELLATLRDVWSFLEESCQGQGALQKKVYDTLLLAEGKS